MTFVTDTWRALLRVFANLSRRRSPTVEESDAAVIALQWQRLRLLERHRERRSEAEVAEICQQRDELAGEISRLPTTSIAAARIKLAIVLEDYVEAARTDGVDLLLLRQVQTWMEQAGNDGGLRPVSSPVTTDSDVAEPQGREPRA